MKIVSKQNAPGATLHAWLSFVSENAATLGLSISFGVVGLVWFGGSSSKQGDTRAMPVSLIEHRKPKLVSVNIEDIRQGDYVLAKDPVTGEVAERKVLQAFARVSDHLRVLTLRSESGEEQTISTTDEHPFFIEGNYECKAGDLRIGDKVVQADGQFAVLIDTRRDEHKTGIAVYNFEVEGFHTYFVSAQGARAPPVWVHNAKCGDEIATVRTLHAPGYVPGDPDEWVTVFRGVHAKHPDLPNAKFGDAIPGGRDMSPINHNDGDAANSAYTAWSTDRAISRMMGNRRGPGGVLLEDKVLRSELFPSPDLHDEGEIFRLGEIFGARVIPLYGK